MRIRNLSQFVLFTVIFCLLSGVVVAQHQKNPGNVSFNFPGLTTALKLIIDLDLSADQVSKMVSLFKENHSAVTSLNKQLKEQAKEFRKSFDPETSDEA